MNFFKNLTQTFFICFMLFCTNLFSSEPIVFESQIIFPLQKQHVHGPTIVECANGDMLAGWFQGSGERWADDVAIMGSRLKKRVRIWSRPFVLVDVPDFPDINPMMFIDPQERLWLFWYTVIANQWETSLPKYTYSSNYLSEGPPVWDWQDVVHFKPGGPTERGIQPNDPFVKSVNEKLNELHSSIFSSTDSLELQSLKVRFNRLKNRALAKANGENMMRKGRLYNNDGTFEDKALGYPYFRRMGWQTKNKPIIINKSKLIVPYYSDGFGFSIMAITTNWGKTWKFSEPLVGPGNIQASLVTKKDGTLVAYMRDNGPPPKKMLVSESTDEGTTWSMVKDGNLPNPGAGTDVVTLQNGHWAIVYNDTKRGRHSLALSISADEGQTWQWTRRLENDNRGKLATASHYPAIIQGKDRLLHIVYSYHFNDKNGKPNKTIKYVKLSEAWAQQTGEVN
jgi:predicted neuraminidase